MGAVVSAPKFKRFWNIFLNFKENGFYPFLIQVFSGKISSEVERFRVSRNQRFSSPPTMVGSGIRKLGQYSSLNLVTTLRHPNSNTVLAPENTSERLLLTIVKRSIDFNTLRIFWGGGGGNFLILFSITRSMFALICPKAMSFSVILDVSFLTVL